MSEHKGGSASTAAVPSAEDATSLMRSAQYRRLLVLAAVVGVIVSFLSWCFLELVEVGKNAVYEDLPSLLGFDAAPSWWPIPILALAGLIVAFAIERLPGRGGHIPAEGLKAGAARPIELPGIALAALATLCLGMVLGPEAPLIALGTGLAVLAVKLSRRDVPPQALAVVAAAGAFAAISTIFGSPVVGAVIMIEATGLGGATLSLVLLPGLIAAGVGSLVFLGMGSWTGLSSSAYALGPLPVPSFSHPTVADFLWTIGVAVVAAVVTFVIVQIARRTEPVVGRRPFLLLPAAAVLVAVLAILFAQITGEPQNVVLFSGQDAFDHLVQQAPTLSLATLGLLLLFKGLAWSISLGNFRGGPTFPALFLGAVGGLMASHLPGFSETPALAALMGAAAVSILRLPLSSILVALLLTTSGGPATAPFIIVGVVVAHLTTLGLTAWRPPGSVPAPPERGSATQGATKSRSSEEALGSGSGSGSGSAGA